MIINASDLRRLAPNADDSIVAGIVEHQALIAAGGIDTPRRLRHFLAQLAHESAGFRTTREYASGEAYEGRKGLGNVQPGDGKRYRGRGLIQITGRANARAAGRAIGEDYEGHPERMEAFPGALRVSIWFWQARDLNRFADRDDVVAVTLAINGGRNGLPDRRTYLKRAEAIWPDAAAPAAQRLLQSGLSGPDVLAWQQELQREGFPVRLDSVFGPGTKAATERLQGRMKIVEDGKVGPATLSALAVFRAARAV